MTETLSKAIAFAAANDGPTAVALMRILIEAAEEREGRAALAQAVRLRKADGDSQGAARLQSVAALWRDLPGAWRIVRSTIDGIAHQGRDLPPEAMLRYWAETFDRLVRLSPEASVALYSLGPIELS